MRPVDHVRDAWRALRRSPRELPLVLAVLSIGVGALSAAYVVGETLFFKPLPYPRADRLVRIWNGRTDTGYRTLAAQEFAVLLEGSTLLAAAAPYAPVEQRLGDGSGGNGNRLRGLLTTPRLFEVDHGSGAVIVNEALARHLFGSIDVLDRALHLGDADATIVGVVRSIRHRGLFETPRPEGARTRQRRGDDPARPA
jgi:hypothetical protein